MSRNRGRRFDAQPRINMKKVIATIIAFLVIIMVVASIIILIKRSKNQNTTAEDIKYFAYYSSNSNNEKVKYGEEEINPPSLGVINSNGEVVIPAKYDLVIVPDKTKGLFITTLTGENDNVTVKVFNENNEEILDDFSNIDAISNSLNGEIWFEENVLKYQENGKYGLIDFDGNVLLSPEYEYIGALNGIERSLLLIKDGKTGLYNNVSKDIIIEPKYKSIEALGKTYNDGYIVKDENDKYGIIGPDKKVILETKYDEISKINGNGMYNVKSEGDNIVINTENIVVLSTGFDEVKSIDGDNIIIRNGDKYGILNSKSETVIEPKYEDLSYCYTDTYIAKQEGKYGVINTLGDVKIDFKYSNIEFRKDVNIFVCDNSDYTSDLYSRELEYKVTGIISRADSEKGYIMVKINNEVKYYNLKFEEKTEKDIFPDNTLFLVKENNKYGYENKDGERIVDCIYDDAMPQNEYGFCSVNKGGKWGALKSDGNVIVEPKLEINESVLIINFIGKYHRTELFDGLEVYTDE
ncbi:MAG: WG repeat-containing protein [Clostridia bacterium]|nr:WG repeat-containing protein [Clostridia bacterium]MBR3152212.1 WG repeat-containing protein [Clostridia bacterium]MBR3152251.1 WG repeat-containing protein [Clostridia bacterium]